MLGPIQPSFPNITMFAIEGATVNTTVPMITNATASIHATIATVANSSIPTLINSSAPVLAESSFSVLVSLTSPIGLVMIACICVGVSVLVFRMLKARSEAAQQDFEDLRNKCLLALDHYEITETSEETVRDSICEQTNQLIDRIQRQTNASRESIEHTLEAELVTWYRDPSLSILPPIVNALL